MRRWFEDALNKATDRRGFIGSLCRRAVTLAVVLLGVDASRTKADPNTCDLCLTSTPGCCESCPDQVWSWPGYDYGYNTWISCCECWGGDCTSAYCSEAIS